MPFFSLFSLHAVFVEAESLFQLVISIVIGLPLENAALSSLHLSLIHYHKLQFPLYPHGLK